MDPNTDSKKFPYENNKLKVVEVQNLIVISVQLYGPKGSLKLKKNLNLKMSKKIAILLASAVYCCLHSLANGYANREESISGGRQPRPERQFFWWDCTGPGGYVGRVCLPKDYSAADALEKCKGHFPKADPPSSF